MTIALAEMHVYVLVFARFSAMILLNPLLARRNVPMMFRMGLVLLMTLLVTPALPMQTPVPANDFLMIAALLRELLVGMALGYVFQLFYYMLFFAGDQLDVEFGMSMAKMFDPSTNIQMSLTGNLLTVLFVLYLFATNGLQEMLYLFACSFEVIPPGGAMLTKELAGFGMELFSSLFLLMFRLMLPFIAAEFTLQAALGVLMKLVPQIHVFVINFQLKQGLGMLLLLLFAPAIGSFIDRYVVLLFENMQRALVLLAG